MTIEGSNLEDHTLKHTYKIEKSIFIEILKCNISGLTHIVHYITQIFQNKKLWKSYNPNVMFVNYTKIYTLPLFVYPSKELIF